MSYLRNLGALEPQQVAQANARTTQLADQLSQSLSMLREAETAGFDRRLLSELRATHARLLSTLTSMTGEVAGLAEGAYADWLVRATDLERQVALYTQRLAGALTQAAPQRAAKIAATTAAMLVIAGTIGGLVWYASKRAPARKYRLRRSRR